MTVRYEDWDEGAHDDAFDGESSAHVDVGSHKTRVAAAIKRLTEEHGPLTPVTAKARSIATSVWGQAWCRNLDLYSDYKTRLPLGRSYLRHGYVLDLKIQAGLVEAKVHGAELYDVTIQVASLMPERWAAVRERSQGTVASLFALLRGELAAPVMALMTDPEDGIFPAPHEIKFGCTCLDWADLCKHGAAVLYGIGARLDAAPELLFTLRGVAAAELAAELALAPPTPVDGEGGEADSLSGVDLGELFGLDLAP